MKILIYNNVELIRKIDTRKDKPETVEAIMKQYGKNKLFHVEMTFKTNSSFRDLNSESNFFKIVKEVKIFLSTNTK